MKCFIFILETFRAVQVPSSNLQQFITLLFRCDNLTQLEFPDEKYLKFKERVKSKIEYDENSAGG